MKKFPKYEVEKEIQKFFSNIKDKNPKGVKKIKRLAMRHNIKLGELRKTFCKKCFMPYKTPSIRIKNDMISITCENCDYVSRWRVR